LIGAAAGNQITTKNNKDNFTGTVKSFMKECAPEAHQPQAENRGKGELNIQYPTRNIQ